MCGRYLTPAEADFERGWKLHAPTGYRQSYNLAPSQIAPVLLAGKGDMRLELLSRNVTDVSVYKVSSYVNKPANIDAGCIARP